MLLDAIGRAREEASFKIDEAERVSPRSRHCSYATAPRLALMVSLSSNLIEQS